MNESVEKKSTKGMKISEERLFTTFDRVNVTNFRPTFTKNMESVEKRSAE